MQATLNNRLLIVLALVSVTGTILAQPSGHRSSGSRPHGNSRSTCNNRSGFSISYSSGNLCTSYSTYNRHYRPPCHYDYHWPIVRSYPKRFPLGPVIVYTSSREPLPVEQKIIVIITNDNGSQTPVELTKIDGHGYRGPKGEYYSQMPSEGQLRALYGIGTVVTTIADLDTTSTMVTVWLENENGSKTPVQLIRQGRSYIGPEGEYYPSMPTKEQLRAIYGLYRTASPDDTTTIIIHNSDGTTTPVVLINDGQNYIGPNGEYYAAVPTAKQLVPIYGK